MIASIRLSNDSGAGISVVIAVHNSAAMLDQCLGALSKSSRQPIECIVVDDASTDNAAAVAERHAARVIVQAVRHGPARARNTGVLHARGEIILFLDADVCLHADAISRILERFEDRSVDAVIGSYDDSPAAKTFVSQYRNLLHCFTHLTSSREAGTFWAGCGAVRKESFLRCGGLDERYARPAIEDIEFGGRLTASGGHIVLDPEIQVQHLKCWTLLNMIKTDIFHRGVPWTRLILRAGSMPNDLNLRWSQRLSVMTAFLFVAALISGAGIPAVLCAVLLFGLNFRFFSFLSARLGVFSLVRAVPLHMLFHFYSGLAFLIGAGLHLRSVLRSAPAEIAGEESS